MSYSGLITKYHQYLPIDPQFIVSLNEGNTPLLPAPRIAKMLGEGIEVHLKFEGLNPTGSFKDRGMTYAVSKALEGGAKSVICASTGNTSASAAAYAARAGMKCYVVIPQGKIALGKLSQAVMHGAEVLEVQGNFDDALKIVREVADTGKVALVNSVNPDRIEGQKTAAFEICEALGRSPTYHALPVGNAGNITACWRGYREYMSLGMTDSKPAMLGFQAAGAAPIVLGEPVSHPETVATAIRIGNPASWKQAVNAREESNGVIDSVTDEEILKAYQILASQEGYFCEPASAAGVAGILKLAQNRFFKKGDVIVCTLTGHGLKDPDTAISLGAKTTIIRPNIDEVMKVIK